MKVPILSKKLAVLSVNALSTVDYSVATKVSERVAEVTRWAYDHDQWWIAQFSINLLEKLDDFGSFLISFVIWIVMNAK